MANLDELKTIRDMIRWAVSSFNEAGLYYGHGSETAWDEAVTLVLRALHLPHDVNQFVLDARLTGNERDTIQKLIARRVSERIPLSYLIHEAWFASLPFFVDERVLIPRSPIAELIENEFQPWVDPDRMNNILDLCTGGGCIAIACAKAFPYADVDASDISNDALAVAKINVLRHGVEQQVQLIQSDLFNNLLPKKYNLIVSNPPYVDAEDMATLPVEYQHEPRLGLAAGADGLDYARRILQDALPFLQDEGTLIVEVGNSEFALTDLYPDIPFTWLEFERGGGGVFMLTAEQLHECQPDLNNVT